MKFFSSTIIALIANASLVQAFVPSPSFTKPTLTGGALSAVDPSMFHDLPQHIDSMQTAFSSLMISDEEITAAATAVADVANSAASVAADTATATSDAAVAAAADGNGWFGFLVGPIEGLLQIVHSVLVAVGIDANAWGVSIVALTLVIKALTYPLTKAQLESTTKMQVSYIQNHLLLEICILFINSYLSLQTDASTCNQGYSS